LTLSRYLGREVLLHFLAVLSVVVGIFLAQRLDVLLSEAADGSLSLGMGARILVLRTLTSLPSLIPVVLYLAVILTLGRWSRDRELIAVATCGVAPSQLSRPLLAIGIAAALLVGWLALSFRPWAAQRLDVVEREARDAVDLEGLAPGRFYPIDDGASRVLFAERREKDPSGGALAGVFLHEIDERGVSVLISERAVEDREVEAGARVLRLLAGRRYDISADGDDLDVTDYGEYVLRAPADPDDEGNHKSEETSELLWSAAPADQAELQWRLSMPVSAFLLVLLAIPLGYGDPRAGKYGRLLAALAIYVVYRQLLGTLKGMMIVGELAPFPGLWAVHAVLAGLALVLTRIVRARPG
jgi:lipopolysaccharide export system permease protein